MDNSPAIQKLNLGCGLDIRSGYFNVDIAKLSGVDQVVDVSKYPLPFESNRFQEILCNDILEHIEDHVGLMRELHRILAPGGHLVGQVPHFISSCTYRDPTHKRGYSVRSFDFYIKDSFRSYYFDFAFTKIERVSVGLDLGSCFGRKRAPITRLISRFVNSSPKSQAFYEDTMLCRLFPAKIVSFVLVK